jgi:hypothetical protein
VAAAWRWLNNGGPAANLLRHGGHAMDDALAYLLDLRLRYRRHPQARAVIDRCLLLLARAQGADAATARALQAEIDALAAELEARLGAPKPIRVH